MDFWSRLLSHAPLSAGNSRKEIAKDPVRRQHRFEREYGQLLQAWRNSPNLVADKAAADTIELRIQELTDILIDESRRPLPHTCLQFSAEKHIYVSIGMIASTSYSIHIVKEAVYFFSTLIENGDDTFVESQTYASSLTNLLLRITGANSIRLDLETQTKVVELAFNITTKIRLRPEILQAWFQARPSQQRGGVVLSAHEKEAADYERFKGKTQRPDFPLFYVLIDYIHSEGKVGDFARTGILYIVESASTTSSASLEQWIVESDLSTLMATGLGALYSQLSRKLVIDHPPNNLPPVLALSDYQHPHPAFDVVNSCSPDFQVQLDTFLSHMLFWQDVLNHCRSTEVKSTLLEHFQVIFLQQLLYPSLLESSDIDGGSSVAVLTYLRRILESLDHPDMINLILHYLLALPEVKAVETSADHGAVGAARKRKSLDLATLMASKAEVTATPLLFNLIDLTLACLKSHNQQTINVTLQLVSVILRRHHRYAIMTLVRTTPVLSSSIHRTIGAQQQEIEFIMATASMIGGQDSFDEIYSNVLKDVVVRLESHPCSLKLLAPKLSKNNHELPAIPDSLLGAPHDVVPHTIRHDEPLLAIMLDRLETFFVNPVDTNLLVTDAFIDLATCGFVSLEGWLVRHPDTYSFDEECNSQVSLSSSSPGALGEGEKNHVPCADTDTIVSMKKSRRRPRWINLPRLLIVLQTLSDQVTAYKQSIPRFDDLLQQRREAFRTADSAPGPSFSVRHKSTPGNLPSTPYVDRTSLEDLRSNSPARPSGLEGLAQRILSEMGTPSRSASPRGRQGPSRSSTQNSGGPASGSVSSGYTTPTSANPAPIIHGDNSTSSKGGFAIARSYSPRGQRGNVSPWEDRDSSVASQIAAFQAVDRQILTRRVGIPATKAMPGSILLDFDQKQHLETPSKRPRTEHEGERSKVKSSAPPSEKADAAPVMVEERMATVSHVLTNMVILQSFLFELAALLQARAGLFDEVRFV